MLYVDPFVDLLQNVIDMGFLDALEK
ncbi:hypothetical protein A2U01_0064415, partial [Trifolium medium]|nr:hypothetical protein [Trifolium medium]